MAVVTVQFCTHEHVWSKLLADKYPHLDVDNFAMPGHGTFYMDMVLKHIMYEREENYDWILVQLTSPQQMVYTYSM